LREQFHRNEATDCSSRPGLDLSQPVEGWTYLQYRDPPDGGDVRTSESEGGFYDRSQADWARQIEGRICPDAICDPSSGEFLTNGRKAIWTGWASRAAPSSAPSGASGGAPTPAGRQQAARTGAGRRGQDIARAGKSGASRRKQARSDIWDSVFNGIGCLPHELCLAIEIIEKGFGSLERIWETSSVCALRDSRRLMQALPHRPFRNPLPSHKVHHTACAFGGPPASALLAPAGAVTCALLALARARSGTRLAPAGAFSCTLPAPSMRPARARPGRRLISDGQGGRPLSAAAVTNVPRQRATAAPLSCPQRPTAAAAVVKSLGRCRPLSWGFEEQSVLRSTDPE
jgi:hypothetical protein